MKTIAVCLVWSIVNPVHERRVDEIIKEEWPEVSYCLSSEVQPILREYHRMSCTILNGMLQLIVTKYLGRLQEALSENGFKGEALIVVSTEGVVPIREIMENVTSKTKIELAQRLRSPMMHYGGWGYDHTLTNVMPLMRLKGMSNEQILQVRYYTSPLSHNKS